MLIDIEFVGGKLDGQTRAFTEPLESIYVIAYPNPDIDWFAVDSEPNADTEMDIVREDYQLQSVVVDGVKEWRYVL